MQAAALLNGDRDEIRRIAHDPRIVTAEAALERFGRTGAVRDAVAYAHSCFSIVIEVVREEFPRDVQGEALRIASVKLLDASTAAGFSDREGWLAWSIAREMRDLALAYGVRAERLRPPRPRREGAGRHPALDVDRLATLARELLRLAGSTGALEEIQQTMGLSSAEAAALFGVTRQAVDQWRRGGVPAERMADVERVRDVARVLYEELVPGRIPQVVRTPARGLEGRTILETLRETGGAALVRAYLARLYAFQAA